MPVHTNQCYSCGSTTCQCEANYTQPDPCESCPDRVQLCRLCTIGAECAQVKPKPKPVPKMQRLIADVCDELKAFLIEKNKAYGTSAADPVRIFSEVDAMEQINVRIDDKLSRIKRGKEFPGDDTELDLIGYLILKRVIKRAEK